MEWKSDNDTIRFLNAAPGGAACVSIHQEPYDTETHRYAKTYCEEVEAESIKTVKNYETIKKKEVDHFNVIGSGMCPVELYIYI